MERIDAQINWAKLVKENRAKDIGVPWSEKELEAIYQKGVDPELIRLGKWKATLTLSEVKLDTPSDNLEELTMVNLKALYKERFKKGCYPTWKKPAIIAALRTGEPIVVVYDKTENKLEEKAEEVEEEKVETEKLEESPVVEDSK